MEYPSEPDLDAVRRALDAPVEPRDAALAARAALEAWGARALPLVRRLADERQEERFAVRAVALAVQHGEHPAALELLADAVRGRTALDACYALSLVRAFARRSPEVRRRLSASRALARALVTHTHPVERPEADSILWGLAALGYSDAQRYLRLACGDEPLEGAHEEPPATRLRV